MTNAYSGLTTGDKSVFLRSGFGQECSRPLFRQTMNRVARPSPFFTGAPGVRLFLSKLELHVLALGCPLEGVPLACEDQRLAPVRVVDGDPIADHGVLGVM
jgi:hypothetical protein